MNTWVKTVKRFARVTTARLPVDTKRRLLRATWRARRSTDAPGADLDIRCGAATLTLAAETFEIDYRTLYGLLIDGQFRADFDGAHVLDIGAHKGYYGASAFAAGATCVESFEPASQNHAYLVRAAASMPCDAEWIVHRSAVGTTAGRATLSLSASSWGHSLLVPADGRIVGTEEVEVVTFAGVLTRVASRRRGRRLVVKINVEGLAGGLITATPPSVLATIDELWLDIEAHDPIPSDEIVDHLAVAGLGFVERQGTLVRFRS